MASEWIGVAEVAAEMNLTDRKAWRLVKRLGVRVVEPERATARTATFLRADFEEARARSMGPAASQPPRAPAAPVAASKARDDRTAPGAAASKLARLRGR